jgi:glycosyltransferase involved in cell wall biosynthesis
MSKHPVPTLPLRLAIIWIDWYAYHIARLQGLLSVPQFAGSVVGIELVGGVGVYAGLRFREQAREQLPIHTLLPDCNWQQTGQLRLARLLWARLNQLKPAAVMIPGYSTLPALAAALWTRRHRRTSILMTESTAADHVRVGWKELIKAKLLRLLFDVAVTGGTAHRRYLEQLGFPKGKVARYYDVVDNAALAVKTSELRRTGPNSFGLPLRPYFLYVGRMSPEKNVEGLLQAWLAYRDEGGEWPLILVGDGPALAGLQAVAAKSQHGSEVHFAGLRTSRELPAFYAFAGCFVLPSVREPWGLVVNEAMASSLPVLVSSRCGSAEDLVEEGQNGFIFDPRSQELKAKLSRIASLSDDQLRAMGSRSSQIIAAYSPQNFGCQVESILEMAGA